MLLWIRVSRHLGLLWIWVSGFCKGKPFFMYLIINFTSLFIYWWSYLIVVTALLALTTLQRQIYLNLTLNTHPHTHTHIHTDEHTHTHTQRCAHTYRDTHRQTHTHTHTHNGAHTHTHRHTHTQAHTHKHTQTSSLKKPPVNLEYSNYRQSQSAKTAEVKRETIF